MNRFAAVRLLSLSLSLLSVSAGAQATDPCLTVLDSEIRKVLLTSALVNPMEIAVAPDKRIFIVEKVSGKVRIFDPADSRLSDALQIQVFSSAPHEGLLGIALDPGFATNHFVYVYYTHLTEAKHILARFTETAGTLAESSKKILLEVPGIRWNNQHHSAGSMAFGPEGDLYLATGENVDPTLSQGYASVTEARRLEDTQATAANSDDLNGKILRIRPQADGAYTVPAGNLFPATAKARPEIFAMGMRNPIRIALDPKTGWVYWGEPGPDAESDSPTRGPSGRDEINRAKAPGFFGWPYFIAENLPYVIDGAKPDPSAPANGSPNNTGLTVLPAAQPSLLAYGDVAHPEYPAFGVNGSRASIMGGVYRFDPALASPRRLPPRFDGSLFIMDWSRDWINEVKLTAGGEVADVLPFLRSQNPNGPIDMAFGADGEMYLLEYDSHALYRVEYTGACKMDGSTALFRPQGKDADAKNGAVLRWVPADGRLLLPFGASHLEVFDGTGRRLWQSPQGSAAASGKGIQAWMELPRDLSEKMLLVRWR